MTLRQPNLERMLQLGLTGMGEALEEQMDLPGSTELDFDDRLAMLLEREVSHRNQRSYRAHLRRAQLRMRADLQDVDCRAGRGISRTVLTRLGAGDWIRNAHNLAVYGPAGCGKSFLLCALAHQACRQQRSVLYRRMPELVADLARLRGTPRHLRLLARLQRVELLVLDDLGLEELSAEGRRDMLEIVEQRYQRKSIAIASQLPVELWYRTVGEGTVADAILDRLVHNAYRIELKGESMRKRAAPPPLK